MFLYDFDRVRACRVTSFKAPSTLELAHDFLWRIHAACPARGEIGIFNRSHYEDVVTVRVRELAPEAVWRARPERIREFERLLTDEGTTVVKCFLQISKEEQQERFDERVHDPAKRWKYNAADLETRKLWSEFEVAYGEAIGETSTACAPWYVVPGDRNWARNVAVATILVETLRRLDPKYPEPRIDVPAPG
ncbi:MAG TPA: PPK2 family polyphosphate kinase [Gaiellaceae bacterium]|nr:PPK2 family polyphosphate kinase [Gaiellaceae bacterium]